MLCSSEPRKQLARSPLPHAVSLLCPLKPGICRALPEARVPLPQGTSQHSSLQPLIPHPPACLCLQGWCNSVPYHNPASHLREREGTRARRDILISSHNHYQNTSSKAYLQFLGFSSSNHSPFTDQPFTVLLRLLQRLLSPEAEATYQNCLQISPCLHTLPTTLTISPSPPLVNEIYYLSLPIPGAAMLTWH